MSSSIDGEIDLEPYAIEGEFNLGATLLFIAMDSALHSF